MTASVPIAVHGASGRMGQALLRLACARADTSVVAALVGVDSVIAGDALARQFGNRAPDLAYASALAEDVRPAVLIDFSTTSAFDRALALAQERRVAFVSGTTGLSDAQQAAMTRAAETIPVLWSANFSIGVAILSRLVREAARLLGGWDCEIVEAHHRNKKDAPSGTALALGREVAQAREADFAKVARLARTGASEHVRDSSEIGFAVVRGGDIVGEHTVVFATQGERVELAHKATDRDIFAQGALLAALALAGAAPGRYELAELVAQGRI